MSFVYLFVSFLSAIFTEEEEKMLKEVKKVPWKDCLFQKNWKICKMPINLLRHRILLILVASETRIGTHKSEN
ncbi:hypothetical protein AAZX31_03G067500 [Glycine max]|nr:hypothetical protein GLYMA_03G074950v4 [Glycine max]KAH1068996.1 hypothetical protein GYH30_006537 [Glycine max]